MSSDAQKIFHLDKVQIICFCCCGLCFWCHTQEIITKSNTFKIFLFSSKIFIKVLCVTFMPLIHFELISVHGIRVQLHSSACGYPVFQHHLLKRLSFPCWMVLASLPKINWCKGLFPTRSSSPLIYMSVSAGVGGSEGGKERIAVLLYMKWVWKNI